QVFVFIVIVAGHRPVVMATVHLDLAPADPEQDDSRQEIGRAGHERRASKRWIPVATLAIVTMTCGTCATIQRLSAGQAVRAGREGDNAGPPACSETLEVMSFGLGRLAGYVETVDVVILTEPRLALHPVQLAQDRCRLRVDQKRYQTEYQHQHK